MLVTPPRIPSRSTGEIEKLLVELGYAVPAELDDDDAQLAESHDELFEEIAAFARRGWAMWFDAETDAGYDEYEAVLDALLKPVGVQVTFDEDTGVCVDGRKLELEEPEHLGDWLDIEWIFEVAKRAVDKTPWILVSADEDLHGVIAGVVPHEAWSAITDKQLAGLWKPLSPVPVLN